ncbi:polyhydroxyalkanoate synthesis regulator DNA-binding domain-containing protein [Pendulispora albinea]|uniref:Polyhydroxyalkanoate synthesis regulator DNA-binding domain-containing protein n=1 Tax=Pendulispora albinea TaxID=2741071 RepID=A0ABZ2LUI9_9BACT
MDTKPETSSQTADNAQLTSERQRRVIKRYSNRKLYDTKDSRYVTLLQIAEMVRTGEDVQIIDNTSKEDLTEVTLAQIIYEEQKAHSRNVPLQTLKELIHSRTEKVLSDLREGPIGRLIPVPKGKTEGEVEAAETVEVVREEAHASKPSLVDQAKETLEDWQHKIDERIRSVLPSSTPWEALQNEVRRLGVRIDELEKKLKAAKGNSEEKESTNQGHEEDVK